MISNRTYWIAGLAVSLLIAKNGWAQNNVTSDARGLSTTTPLVEPATYQIPDRGRQIPHATQVSDVVESQRFEPHVVLSNHSDPMDIHRNGQLGQALSDANGRHAFAHQATGLGNPMVRTVSSLGVVAGLMVGFIWWSRKNHAADSTNLPNNLVEVVGRVPLDAKHKAHLVRFGDRILLLSLDSSGVSKLGEIELAEVTNGDSSNLGVKRRVISR